MKRLAKIAVSFFMAITLLSTIMLKATSTIDLPSQSSYANQPNVFWYIMIHVGMILSFFVLNAATKKKLAYLFTAFSSILILMLDMYGFGTLHNIATALLFGFASYSLIFYSNLSLKTLYFYVSMSLGAVFGTVVLFKGLLPLDIYDIETIIEWTFATMLVIDLYFFKKNTK